MTASQKQLNSNRLNAQKSTGPKTDEGKAVSSQNGVKHGLYSGHLIINSPHLKEDRAEFDLLLNSLCDELQPATLLQKHLVYRMAESIWRRRRLISAETAQITDQLNDIDSTMNRLSRFKAYSSSRAGSYSLDYPDRSSESDSPDESPDPADDQVQMLAKLIGIRSIPYDFNNKAFLRYEARLERQITFAYKLLRLLQLNTRKISTNLPQKHEKRQDEPDSP